MKEDRHAFGVMLEEEKYPFWYPVTSVQLSLAFPDSTLRQSPKHHFRNYLTDGSKACESTKLNDSRWIIDTMSVMRAITVKETYKEWFKTVIKFTLPNSSLNPLSIMWTICIEVLVLKTALEMKEDNLRQDCTCKVYQFSITLKISNISLFILTYLRADDFIHQSPLPILVNNENETRMLILEWLSMHYSRRRME